MKGIFWPTPVRGNIRRHKGRSEKVSERERERELTEFLHWLLFQLRIFIKVFGIEFVLQVRNERTFSLNEDNRS
jgi:hypothetical protein